MTDEEHITESHSFADSFPVKDEVDYGWVVEQANRRYDDLLATYRRLDDKAAAVITTVGGGAGLYSLGSLAALSTGTVHAPLLLAALPAFWLALVCLCHAVRTRRTVALKRPAELSDLLQAANEEGKGARAVYALHVHVTIAESLPVIEEKAARHDESLDWLLASLVSLQLPLLTGLAFLASTTLAWIAAVVGLVTALSFPFWKKRLF